METNQPPQVRIPIEGQPSRRRFLHGARCSCRNWSDIKPLSMKRHLHLEETKRPISDITVSVATTRTRAEGVTFGQKNPKTRTTESRTCHRQGQVAECCLLHCPLGKSINLSLFHRRCRRWGAHYAVFAVTLTISQLKKRMTQQQHERRRHSCCRNRQRGRRLNVQTNSDGCCRNSWPEWRRNIEPVWKYNTSHLVHCPQYDSSRCTEPVAGTGERWLAEEAGSLVSPGLSPRWTGDRQPSDPSRRTRICVPPTRCFWCREPKSQNIETHCVPAVTCNQRDTWENEAGLRDGAHKEKKTTRNKQQKTTQRTSRTTGESDPSDPRPR